MIFRVVLLLALCVSAFAHELVVDIEMDRPKVLLQASYGPGEPARSAAVIASLADPADRLEIDGRMDEKGAFVFEPPVEGEWVVRVDDGYGHIATRAVVIDWDGGSTEAEDRPSLLARTGAGVVVILGLTTFVIWGRRRLPDQRS